MTKRNISTKEAAELLQTSQRWVNYLIARGDLDSTRLSSGASGAWLVPRTQVTMLAKQRIAKAKTKGKVGSNGRANANEKKGGARSPDRKKRK